MLALAVALPVAVVLVQFERRRARAPRRRSAFARGVTAAGSHCRPRPRRPRHGRARRQRREPAPWAPAPPAPAEALRRSGDRRQDPAQPLRRQRPGRQDVRALEPRGRRARRRRRRARSRSACATTPIQPLVIRANEGDCVEIAYTQQRLRRRVRHPHRRPRLRHRVLRRPGRPATPSSAPAPRRQHAPTATTSRTTRRSRARTTCAPGPGNRPAVAHGLFGVARRRAQGLDLARVRRRPAARLGLGGDDQARRPGKAVPRVRAALPRDRQRAGPPSVPTTRTASRCRRSTRTPAPTARLARHQLPLRAVHEPPRQGRRRVAVVQLATRSAIRRRRSRAPTWAIRRSSASSTPARRCSTSSTCTAAASAGASTRWPTRRSTTQKTGLDKYAEDAASPSTRLDSQATGPGESYNLEIEGGAGGVQQAAGDFLYHCHIAEHYVSGMWGFWRVYDTSQPGLRGLAGSRRAGELGDSAGLIGRTMPDGTTITADNLDAWISPQLPPQGVPQNDQDASVWNWTVDSTDPAAPVYLGEPEDTSALGGPTTTRCPAIRRPIPATCSRRSRATRSPDRSSSSTRSTGAGVPAAAYRTSASARRSRRTATPARRGSARPASRAIGHGRRRPVGGPQRTASARRARPSATSTRGARRLPLQVTRPGAVDPNGKIFVLAHDKADVLAGRKPASRWRSARTSATASPSRSRACSTTRTTSRASRRPTCTSTTCSSTRRPPTASITGMSYEQTVRPFQAEDPQITAGRGRGRHDAQPLERGEVPGRRVDRGRPGHREHRDPPDRLDRRGREDDHADHSPSRTPTRRVSTPAWSSCSTAGIPTSSSTTSSGTTTSTASTAGATASSAS